MTNEALAGAIHYNLISIAKYVIVFARKIAVPGGGK